MVLGHEEVAVHAPVGAPGVLDDPVLLAVLGLAVAHHQDAVVELVLVAELGGVDTCVERDKLEAFPGRKISCRTAVILQPAVGASSM